MSKLNWPKGGSGAARRNPRDYYAPRPQDYKKEERADLHKDSADRFRALAELEDRLADPRIDMSANFVGGMLAAGVTDPAVIAGALEGVLRANGQIPFTAAEVSELFLPVAE